MIIEMFMMYQIIVIVVFIAAFYTKQEILWSITLILSGALMFTSWDIGKYTYLYNTSSNAYAPVVISNSYPYLMGINFIFFGLTLALLLFDIFEKYGVGGNTREPNLEKR